jgi:KUP system potassium uptake protein
MSHVDVEQLLKGAGIKEKNFYGFEWIITRNIFWKIFSLIKRLSHPLSSFNTNFTT